MHTMIRPLDSVVITLISNNKNMNNESMVIFICIVLINFIIL